MGRVLVSPAKKCRFTLPKNRSLYPERFGRVCRMCSPVMVASPKPPLDLPENSAAIGLVEPLTCPSALLQSTWSNFELMDFSPAAAGTGGDLTAKLITTNQRIRTGVTYPKSNYSRVVSCTIDVEGDGGLAYAHTPAVGEVVWLLAVKLWAVYTPGATIFDGRVYLHTGTSTPQSLAELAAWEELLPIFVRTGATAWPILKRDADFSWDMSRLFTGAARRFGFRVENTGDGELNVMASFQISEG